MAHQTEIVINGVTTEVTEFDHTAQEIDDGIDNLHTLTGGATTPQAALANLGAGVRPNLLINPFFQVNQRGQSSYGRGMTVDMWRLGTDGNGKATVANDGIIISGNTGTYCNFEGGIEEVPPGTYTESFLVDDHTKVSQIYANGGGQFNITENLISYTFEVKSELDSVYWGIQKLLSAGDLKIFGAKLEEGDTQTLAYQDEAGAWQLLPQPESDYATQLAKCQRYLAAMEEQTIVRSAYVSTNFVDFLVPIPVSFRVLPIIQSAEKLVLITQPDGANVSGVTWSIATKSSASVRLRASKPNILSEGTDFAAYTDQGATFFSAEL